VEVEGVHRGLIQRRRRHDLAGLDMGAGEIQAQVGRNLYKPLRLCTQHEPPLTHSRFVRTRAILAVLCATALPMSGKSGPSPRAISVAKAIVRARPVALQTANARSARASH
jgi:hypothetical protein